jgi:hypothetical protein
MIMGNEFSLNTGQKLGDTMTSEHGHSQTLNASILSAGGSRVRTLALLEKGLALAVSDPAYSSSLSESFASWSQGTCCWKTSQRCLFGGWIPYSERWPRSGLMQNGIAYRLPVLVPRISGTGSSFWPTPKASRDGTSEVTLQMVRDGKAEKSLERIVKMPEYWPTPHATCGTGPGSGPNKQGGENLQTAVGGRLNPAWVEWLMGFPHGWTDLEDSETP